MNHPYMMNANAKARHAHLIETAATHRRAKALMGDKPTFRFTLRNLIRRLQPISERREQVPGSLEAGRTA